MPASTSVELFVGDANKVRRQLDVAGFQRNHSAAPKLPDEVAQFKNDILPSTGALQFFAFQAANIVGRQKDNREAYIAMLLELLNDRLASIRLFMQNYDLKADALKKSRDRLAWVSISTMNDEN